LKRLYKHYFGGQIQQGNHTAYADAAATMQLFKQAYIPWAEIHSPLIKYPVPIGYFDNIE